MYGPQGGFFWDSLDSAGNPILKNVPGDEFAAETERYRLWHWTLAGHATNVDRTKFAVNDSLPEGNRKWVETIQAHYCTPLMHPITDEYTAISSVIEPDTDLAIKRTLIQEYMDANIPLAIMAASATEAQAIIDDIVAFITANGVADVEAAYIRG
jgi:hypothetical protein